MQQHRNTLLTLLIVLSLLGAGAGYLLFSQRAQAAQAQREAPQYLLLRYTIDRSALPPLTFRELTLEIDVGQVQEFYVIASGYDVQHSYDREAGTLLVTTAAPVVHVLLQGPESVEGSGQVRKAPLKFGKAWAWSHSLDDNTDLEPSIALLEERGWRGTLFMIGKHIEDERQEAWIVDAPRMKELLAEGWSVGNHTWDHACGEQELNDAQFMQRTIRRTEQRLAEIIATSSRPNYRPIAFASPCFAPEYHDYVEAAIAAADSPLLFDEAGNDYLLQVDGQTIDDENMPVVPFNFDRPIGRDGRLQLGDEGVRAVRDVMDWMSANTSPQRHFWYNTFSHGGEEAALEQAVAYAYETYGPAGSDELWMAPSDEIYSYLLVRERSEVQGGTVTSWQ